VTVELRTRRSEDADAVLAVVAAAFSSRGRDGTEEIGVVTETWRLGAAPAGLDVVADDRGVLVGHVLAAVGDMAGTPAIGIAPLAVLPERQRQGIGSALMVELLRRIEGAGWPIAVLLGDPRYYSRFGFEPAGRLGITYPPVGNNSPDFMVRRLSAEADVPGGDFGYCWERARPDETASAANS
jgi:putative acetyltransferase